ncbi:MAG TPA: helix-turn-helix domain-containing protein [Candidatus Acidoferrales bacterium]|nr:helix-turn-helix domain-containing protein [Candidatus Acidoferrales bacterium]
MLRLIVELSAQDFSKFDPESSFEKMKSMEVLHFLKYDHWEVAKILRVEFNEPNASIEAVFRDRLIEAQILEQEKEKKTGRDIYTYFIKVRPPLAIRRDQDPKAVGGYLSLPYVVKDGKVKITFLGNTKQMRTSIKIFEDAGVRYRVVSLTDAKISPYSLISRLTEKQRNALITAYTLGYYDVPRKISLVQLAKTLNLARSTLDKHLRKAEQRLLHHIMNES